MTTAEFLQLVRSVCPEIQESHLSLPVGETPLDSLDLLTLRSTLEARIGRHLGDEQWLQADSLAALLRGLS